MQLEKQSLLKTVVAALMAASAVPSNAAPFGHSREDRLAINKAFGSLADMCSSSFGFTRVPKKADTVLVDKMEAYLLLAPNADDVISHWSEIASDAQAMERAKKDDALANRLADALIAAEKDPDSYARAEAHWLETFKGPVEIVVGACRAAAREPFIGTNYLSGDGSAERYDERLKAMFADSVKHQK